jgi:acetyltransferase-like isoleucine patch superfamily enzyme
MRLSLNVRLAPSYGKSYTHDWPGTNCVRGGFVCYGYPNQRAHPKIETKPIAVPLESKDPSYVPPGAYGMPQPSAYSNPTPNNQPPKRDSVSSYRGQYLRLETQNTRSSLTDDDRPTASTHPTTSAISSVLSPENKATPFSAYSNAANMFPTPISAITPSVQQLRTPNNERPREYPRVPPLHDTSRTEPEISRPGTPRPGSLPQMNVLEPTPPAASVSQLPSTDPQMAAKLALSHTQYPPNTSKPRTQKEEMLVGREYYPFDPELVKERQRCSAACWRFNNSTNPNTGVSPTERSRLFREILNPHEPIHLSPQMLSSITRTGRVGQEVVVEAPFTCDYGYNITIGNNVLIGRNCTILDAMEIKIGDNCFIGPNVTLLGATTFTDPKKRMGSKSPQIGGSIIIHEDVWIGAGAIIQHNVRIGRGASISAGAVVVKVKPFLLI